MSKPAISPMINQNMSRELREHEVKSTGMYCRNAILQGVATW